MSDQDMSQGLGEFAFVAVEGANCLYYPIVDAAIRIIPPLGTRVQVVKQADDWVMVRFCGKEAWSPRANLSSSQDVTCQGMNVGCSPEAATGYVPYLSPSSNDGLALEIEYGPRGGRFVRTASGFRRYL